jgi:hypothetical protein
MCPGYSAAQGDNLLIEIHHENGMFVPVVWIVNQGDHNADPDKLDRVDCILAAPYPSEEHLKHALADWLRQWPLPYSFKLVE